jgi:hypothetical protein
MEKLLEEMVEQMKKDLNVEDKVLIYALVPKETLENLEAVNLAAESVPFDCYVAIPKTEDREQQYKYLRVLNRAVEHSIKALYTTLPACIAAKELLLAHEKYGIDTEMKTMLLSFIESLEKEGASENLPEPIKEALAEIEQMPAVTTIQKGIKA